MSSSPLRNLPIKKQRFVKEVASGKSKKASALAAGYSPSTARATGTIETPDVKAAFSAILRQRIRPSAIVKRIKEGMDATETKYFSKDGVVTDSREDVNFRERREYTTIAAQMGGYWNPKQDIDVTRHLDADTARRLSDIADKLALSDLEWEERRELRKSHVTLQLAESSDETSDEVVDSKGES